MVEIIEITCDASWKSKSSSWIRKREKVKIYSPKIGELMNMLYIAGRKRGIVIGTLIFHSDSVDGSSPDIER
jgi:hypothetical protein